MTYGGHPLACAAAIGAILDEGTSAGSRLRTDILEPGLTKLAENPPCVGTSVASAPSGLSSSSATPLLRWDGELAAAVEVLFLVNNVGNHRLPPVRFGLGGAPRVARFL